MAEYGGCQRDTDCMLGYACNVKENQCYSLRPAPANVTPPPYVPHVDSRSQVAMENLREKLDGIKQNFSKSVDDLLTPFLYLGVMARDGIRR